MSAEARRRRWTHGRRLSSTWQAWHFQHRRRDMCGRRGTFGTFMDVRGSSATTVDPWTPTVFYVAGVTLSAPPARCVWQAWRFWYLHRCPRKLGDDGGPMDADCLLRGRRDTFSTAGAMCVAGVALSVPS